jgi:Integrase repeat unit
LKLLAYSVAKEYVHKLNLKSKDEWFSYCSSGARPIDIPYNPSQAYKDSWSGRGDWLGTGRIANQNREFLSFENARKYVRSLNLKSSHEWGDYSKSTKRPRNIPSTPDRYYKDKWKGLGDSLLRKLQLLKTQI